MKKLDSVKKKHYIDQLVEEDDILTQFLKDTDTKVEVAQDANAEVQMEVGDVLDEYKQTIRNINEVLN